MSVNQCEEKALMRLYRSLHVLFVDPEGLFRCFIVIVCPSKCKLVSAFKMIVNVSFLFFALYCFCSPFKEVSIGP